MRVHIDTLPRAICKGIGCTDSHGWIHGAIEFNERDETASFVSVDGCTVYFKMTKPIMLSMTHDKIRFLSGVVCGQDRMGNVLMEWRELNVFLK